jgi:D-alanyl-D-alanine carboxypeptidase
MPTPAPRPLTNSKPKLLLFILSLWLGLFCWTGTAHAQFHFQDYNKTKLPQPDEIKAVGALMVDARTGEVLFARNENQHLLPASTTKLMTALIARERLGGLKGSIVVDPDDRAEPSNIPVVPGETISVDTLFHALLIESANDSARTLGRAVAGSVPAFVDMMNQKAIALGCFDTHFYNPNGLPAPNGSHYTSAHDLMVIFRQVLKYPELRKIMSTKDYTIHTASGVHNLRNHNRLLGYYPGMGPAKTGWTEAARHTYACSVTQNGREILLVLLDSPNKWADAQLLYNWAYAQSPGAPGTSVTLPASDDTGH